MPTGQISPILRCIYAVSGAATPAGLPDAELLARFADRGDDTAFSLLVRRHGPMVLGVCRRVARDTHDADDAFQATFLLLSRKAGSLRQPEMVGPWLHGVARRTAAKARAASLRRQRRFAPMPDIAAPAASNELIWRDLRPVLDDAIAGLPARYRDPVVFCYLQGLTYAQAARRIGCPAGTVATHLSRAKQMLRTRLTRLGLAPAAGLLATTTAGELTAAVPSALAAATVRAATAFAAGSAAGVVSTSVLTLTKGLGDTMLVHSWKIALAAVGLMGVIGTSAWTYQTNTAETPVHAAVEKPVPQPTAQVPPEPPPAEREEPTTIKTDNFIVYAPTKQLAEQFGHAAETCRLELALKWLQEEMPTWSKPCPLYIKPKGGVPIGSTKLNFTRPGNYEVVSMELEGDVARLLSSNLPHEITHTVFAHFFRCPVPRWADEGGAVLAEDGLERRIHERRFGETLNRRTALSLRRLFSIKEYSELPDATLVYYQGFSVAQFLVDRGGHQAFLSFVKTGMRDGWDDAAKFYFNFASVDEMQAAWLRSLPDTRATAVPNFVRPSPAANFQVVQASVNGSALAVYSFGTQTAQQRWPAPAETGSKPVSTANDIDALIGRNDNERTYPLDQVQAHRAVRGELKKIERSALADALRPDILVIACPAEVAFQAKALLTKLIKDGTIVLVLPQP